MADARPAWRAGSRAETRKSRLPANWDSEIRPLVFATYGDTCHRCHQPGADEVDHVRAGDDHRIENLRPIHGWRTPQRCHAKKSSAEGAAARPRLHRPPEAHPAFD